MNSIPRNIRDHTSEERLHLPRWSGLSESRVGGAGGGGDNLRWFVAETILAEKSDARVQRVSRRFVVVKQITTWLMIVNFVNNYLTNFNIDFINVICENVKNEQLDYS